MTIVRVVVLWCLGIWIATATTLPSPLWSAGAVAGVLATIVLWKRRSARLAAVCLLAFFAGGVRTVGLPISSSPTLNAEPITSYGVDQELTLVGQVISPPRVYDRRADLTVAVDSIQPPGRPAQPVQGLVLVQTHRFPLIHYGARLEMTGRLEEPPTSPDFDYRAYLARRDIHRLIRHPALEIVAQEPVNPFYHTLYQARAAAQRTIYRLLPDPQASLLSGILLGDDSGIPPDLQQAFRRTGMSHIIAISGFNIALLAGVLLRGSRPLLGHRRAAWLALTGVGAYTLLVGADASVVRAAIMGALYITSTRFLGRPTFAPAGLAVAALGMSLANPLVLWDVGFQLSFAATLGLMLYAEPLSRWTHARLERWLQRDFARRLMPLLSETVLVTLAAQVTTLPLMAYHFGEISLASLPANMLILPAQPGVMLWGALATIGGLLAPALGQILAWPAWLFLTYTIELVWVMARLPFAVTPASPGLPTLVSLYALLFGATWLLRRPQAQRQQLWVTVQARAPQAALGLSAMALILVWQWRQTQPDGLLHVVFLDVGQGDAVFIQTPQGRQFLVDGGHYPSVLNAQLGRQVPFWDRRLDVIVATHPDDDHVAGLPGVLDRYDVDLLLTNGAPAGSNRAYDVLLQNAEAQATTVRRPQPGERWQTGDGVTLTFLHPGPVPLESDNDNSVSFHLNYGAFSLLLTGDAESAGERAMLQQGQPLQAMVFKAGHHGARTSSNDFFLEAVQPQIVVISAGADNQFGHPHEEVLQRAAEAGAAVLRTDQLGTIEVITDGERVWWEAAR
ncbi:MAG TPA: DNA internalization-related competence protein ComEC/Rec2 [Candidatus Sulfomarinibacteraceae bacterium]|nr:DNA internalization-related competence protein ComEC/Rec2 [Candidatus Sulfomarinibacteraceae bacterium]